MKAFCSELFIALLFDVIRKKILFFKKQKCGELAKSNP